ncbi:hypothetical protein EJD97_000912 [Solanum chilense]|uniref:Uncharacterized protein n=1 Tax=Solanum chilense TaxID=4083 RepID=A0A6N2AMK6_SOLCI|nr:hypothetical protein EJD97_000912 [Solanum chilense]
MRMSSSGDGDRHCEHLGVRLTKQSKKKKFRRPIDPEDIAESMSSALDSINDDTHILVPFSMADPQQYYPNNCQSRYVHSYESSSATATPNATPDDEMPPLVPDQKDGLGRVIIQPNGSP